MGEKKERVFDKPRIASTVVIGIFLIIGMIFALSLVGITWAVIDQAVEDAKNSSDNAAGQIAGASAVALVAAIGIVLVMGIYIAVAIDMSILLPFAIKNRKSTLKPIRIISYVYDGLIGATLLLSIIKIILFICKV